MALSDWHTVFMISSFAVAIGDALETPEVIHDLRTGNWQKRLAAFGFVVLVIGLFSEIYSEKKIDDGRRVEKTHDDLTISKLNDDIARAKLETEIVKARVVWRLLSREQCETIASSLSTQTAAITIEYSLGDPEAMSFAIQIDNCFANHTGWKVNPRALMIANSLFQNLIVTGTGKNIADVREGLQRAHLPFDVDRTEIDKRISMYVGAEIPADVRIFVGSKPNFEFNHKDEPPH